MTQFSEGFTLNRVYLVGSNVSHVRLLMCDECGALVLDTLLHRDWHEEMENRFAPRSAFGTIIVSRNPATAGKDVGETPPLPGESTR